MPQVRLALGFTLAFFSLLMTVSLEPAALAFRDDGTPFSPLYGDVYHSTAGALAQAQHVFIAGNTLPRRWRGRRLFTILETGFGIGGNFLATWAAWRADSARCERLAFVSIEKHPFRVDDLRALHRQIDVQATIAPLANALAEHWPMPLAGVHRLEFDGGRVTLTIAFGDALEMLPRLWLRANAFYLDGFSPSRNPDLWSEPVFKALARVAGEDATLATYTCAGHVRRALETAGFRCEKAPGFAGKREMLIGTFAPRWRVRRYEPPQALAVSERHAIVIGAGLAGCALTERLAARGWRMTLLERHANVAQDASGNPAGVFHPLVSRDDSVASRITRAGFLYALQRWRTLEGAGHAFERTHAGLLQLPANDAEAVALAEAVATLGYPSALCQLLSAAQASALAGIPLARGSVLYPQGGSLNPAALAASLVAAAGNTLEWRGNTRVERIAREGESWTAFDENGMSLAHAPVVIFANANDAMRAAGLRHAPTRLVRGQLTRLPAHTAKGLRIPVISDGYAIPITGALLTGATYELDDIHSAPRSAGQSENLARLAQLLPHLAPELAALDIDSLGARVAFRCVTSDRLPMAGALADEAGSAAQASALRGAHALDLPRAPGLFSAFAFGSRGLVWSSLAAELIASQLEGEPWPIERDLAESLDPGRYLLRALRQSLPL